MPAYRRGAQGRAAPFALGALERGHGRLALSLLVEAGLDVVVLEAGDVCLRGQSDDGADEELSGRIFKAAKQTDHTLTERELEALIRAG